MRASYVVTWAVSIIFLSAASWPSLSASAYPLLGLRALTAPTIGWPIATATMALAVFLSVPPLPPRDKLLVGIGFSSCLMIASAVYVASGPALLCLAIVGALLNAVRRLPPPVRFNHNPGSRP